MVSTGIATILALLSLIAASCLGVGVGYLTCLTLRLPWNLRGGVVDLFLAASAAVISAYALSAMDAAQGILRSRVSLILVLAAASVVVRHLVRLGFRYSR